MVIIFALLLLFSGCSHAQNNWIYSLYNELTNVGLSEDTSAGTFIGSLQYQSSMGPITYSTTSPFFAVQQQTGEVRLLRTLIPAKIQPKFVATFYVNGLQNFQDKIDVTVKVIGVNHPPSFEINPYIITLNQNTSVGTLVYQDVLVTDKDVADNGTFTVMCDLATSSQEACSTFLISSATVPTDDTRKRISFNLTNPLIYTRIPFYNLSLLAMDNGSPQLTGRSNLIIYVANPYDTRPLFLNTPIVLSITELAPVDTIVGTIQVQDKREYLVENGLRFYISNDSLGWFVLTAPNIPAPGAPYVFNIKSNGNVTIRANKFDTQYFFNIVARQTLLGQESSVYSDALVTVKINDININKPTFVNSPYNIDYTPQAGVTTIPGLYMLIQDQDLGDNAFFVLSMTYSPAPVNDIFSIVPTYGQGSVSAGIVLNKPEYVNYNNPNERQYQINVTVAENKTKERYSNWAIVTLNVLSQFNSPPYFPSRILPIALFDNSAVGTVISSTIKAVDSNSGTAGIITYGFSPYNNDYSSSTYLKVDPATGIITLARQVSYQIIQQIMVNFTATDGLGGQTYTIFPISIVSSQNSGPKFSKNLYETSIPENTTNLGLNVSATPLVNDRVTMYMLIGNTYNNLFSVNPSSGILTMNRPVLSSETPSGGYYQLIVQASYSGWTDQPVSNASIYIFIQEPNNHPPVFNPTVYSKTITEITPPGTVITYCLATDVDKGPNGLIKYFIQSGSKDNFVIDYSTGKVTVAPFPILSIDMNGERYNMTIIAVDSGQTPLTGTATLFVTVTDSVYRPPLFNSSNSNYIYYVAEKSPSGFFIGKIFAYSPDRRGILSYSIISSSYNATDKAGNTVIPSPSNDYTRWFSVGSSNGIISVQPYSYPISYDVAAVVTFAVLVNVVNPETQFPLNTTAFVKIFITPSAVSTESIIFIPVLPSDNILRRVMNEKMPVGTVVDIFQAYLNSPTLGSQIIYDYTLTQVNDPNRHLEINRTSGAVQIIKLIKYSDLANKTLIYTLTANAPYPSTVKSSATIYYTILSITGSNPVFTQTTYYFNISSDYQVNNIIGYIQASVDMPGSKIIYSYISTASSVYLFPLNNMTGAISLASRLDQQPYRIWQYYLTATATVVGINNPVTNLANIFINVNSIHVLAPQFQQSSYVFVTQVGQNDAIGQVFAKDPDVFTFPESNITYSIVDNNQNIFILNAFDGIIRPVGTLTVSGIFYLVVKATDLVVPPHLSNTTQVTILVNNLTSTGYPVVVYPRPTDQFDIYQNSPDNQIVVKLNTTSSKPVSFTYEFAPGNPPQCYSMFTIDSAGNVIALPNKATSLPTLSCGIIIKDNSTTSLSTSVVIVTNIFTDNPPNTSCFKGPIMLTAYDNMAPPQNLVPPINQSIITKCSNQKPNSPLYFKVIGANMTNSSAIIPFYMIDNQMVLNQSLNWYDQLVYNVTVQVFRSKNDADSNTNNPNSTMQVIVTLIGSNTRPPSFSSTNIYCVGIGSQVTIGILDTLRVGTPIIQMYAGNCNLPGTSSLVYSLTRQSYIEEKYISDGVYFKIDKDTGYVSTVLSDYRPSYMGYYNLSVQVTNPTMTLNNLNPRDTSTLTIYILRETDKAKFVFDKSAIITRDLLSAFISSMNKALPNMNKIYTDKITTYIDPNGVTRTDQSSVCYFMVDGYTKFKTSYDVAQQASFDVINNAINNQDFIAIGITKYIPMCYTIPKTTRFWGGYWPVWPTLVALALLVFVVAMLLTYCVCWYWPRNKRKIEKHKPYVVLDEPPMSQAGSVFEYH